MDVYFKNPTEGDIDWLISVHGSTYARQFGFDAQFEIDIARKVASFNEKIDDFKRILLAYVDNERAGSVAVSRESEKVAFINFLLVLDRFRGQGIAKQLIDRVIVHARENRCEMIRLETYSLLTAAREVYRNYGFKLVELNAGVKKYGRVFDQEFWELVL